MNGFCGLCGLFGGVLLRGEIWTDFKDYINFLRVLNSVYFEEENGPVKLMTLGYLMGDMVDLHKEKNIKNSK
jgi:hypothetical protein